jgi:hypothetical protein
MRIFDLDEDSNVVIAEEIREIPEFKKLVMRDKDRQKRNALRELSYVYHKSDYRSVYNNYSPVEKLAKLKEDFKVEAEDDVIKSAISKYLELTQTPIIRLLNSSRQKIDELAEYIEHTTITDDTIEVFIKASEKIPNLINALDKIEEKVKADQSMSGSRTKGGKVVSKLEE